ncbi:PREDICTED: uncharacterized protein LOC109190316 [Ipomoea nil]|uniref:uncharacterized protein LOC109190316 n=1 Tax=Ipomoea nil TaxID=35883 RepID=UPI0009015445|nr:PREDICTED: uncharacterized protein LOC109190316 [Ipomoea nil]
MPDKDLFQNCSDWISHIFNTLQPAQLGLFVVICWNICRARNDKVWRNLNTTARAIVENSRAFLRDWEAYSVDEVSHLQRQIPCSPKWQKPKPRWLKLNVDAALDTGSGKMGLGWVLRDDHGGFLAAACMPWIGLFSPREAKALAIREALSWCKRKSLEFLHVETDSLLVVQGLSSHEFVSSFDLLLADVKDLLSYFCS